MDTPERRVWVKGGPKDRVTFLIILVFTLNTPQNIYMGPCKGCISVIDLHCTGFTCHIRLLTLTCTALVWTCGVEVLEY